MTYQDTRFKMKLFILLLAGLLNVVNLFSQTVLSEGFESGFPPSGWTVIQAGQGNVWAQNTNPLYAVSGTKSMMYASSPYEANTWIISSSMPMQAKLVYRISFYYASSSSGSTERLRVTIGSGNTIAAQQTVLHERTTFSTAYREVILYYSPSENGNLNLGFQCYSLAAQKEVYIDSVVVRAMPPGIVRYVRSTATGLNDGSSWANAFTSLTSAVTASQLGDTIKVSAGTYKPGNASNTGASFGIKDFLVVLGGYPNTGNPTDAQRDWKRNQTILSGENSAEYYYNSRHVVHIQNTSNKTVLDGFVIEKGYADWGEYGGGIRFVNSSAIVRNCILRNNLAAKAGSAVSAQTNSNPTFMNCYFTGNGNPYYSPVIYLLGSRAQFINCVFARNNAQPVINAQQQSDLKLINCTFFGNQSFINDPHQGTVRGEANSTVSVRNSIFFSNRYKETTDSTDIISIDGSVSVNNSILQAYEGGENNLRGSNPKFRDTLNLAGADGIYFTDDDGLQIMNPCSPAMNTGDNEFISGIVVDILGNNRVANGVVDIGAYEVQSVPQNARRNIYVNKAATGVNDGSNWANAFTDLQTALQYCGDTIRVAAGTYYPSLNDPRQSFLLESGRVIVGGYPATGNPSHSNRQPDQYRTILSGRIPASGGQHSYSVVRGSYLDDKTKVDGVVITGAQSNAAWFDTYRIGAISMSHRGSPVFVDCRISENNGAYGSALVTRDSSNPAFIRCIFEYDTATAENNPSSPGGVITNFGGSAPRFSNCIFRYNRHFQSVSVPNRGGVFYNDNANPVIDSCLFFKNLTYGAGAAMFNMNGSKPRVTNSQFIGNIAGIYVDNSFKHGSTGGDIHNDNSSPYFRNCLFIDSTYCSLGGSVANVNNTSAIFEHCEFRNASAVYAGGAIYNMGSTALFRSCVFNSRPEVINLISTPKGLIYNTSSNLRLENCVVSGAYGYEGSVLYSEKSKTDMINCSIVNNRYIGNSYSLLYSIYSFDGSITNIENCLFANNKYPNRNYRDFVTSTNIHHQPSQTNVKNSILETATELDNVDGNKIGVDPQFADLTNPWGGDGVYFTADDGLQLKDCSPAVNSGSNQSVANIPNDILGADRINGNVVDMGAYEGTGRPGLSLSVSDSAICAGSKVTFTAHVIKGGNNPVYRWKVNGVDAGSNTSVFTSTSLANDDEIQVFITSDEPCLSENSIGSRIIKMAVTSGLAPSILISGPSTIISDQLVVVSSSIVNGGNTPLYQWQDSTATYGWQDILGANDATLTYNAVPGVRVRCRLTSAEICASPVTVFSESILFRELINPFPEAPENFSIRLFPNPVTQELLIDSLNLSDNWRALELVNLSGRPVMPHVNVTGKSRLVLDVSILSPGIYLVIIRGEDQKRAIRKMVKK